MDAFEVGLLLLLHLPLAAGCASGDTASKDSTGDSGSPSVTAPTDVVLDDTTDALTITVSGGSATGWLFGVIDSSAGETGESCHDASDLCHTLDAAGGSLSWCASPTDTCTAVAQLYYREGIESFVLKPAVGVGCWSWGDSASYYDDLGCTQTSWDPSSYH